MSTPAQERAWDGKAIAPEGASLADLRPDLAARAIRNLSRPSVEPARLRLRSNANVLWRCQCGVEYAGTVSNAVKTQVFLCRTCQRVGKSRFEFQVAALLRLCAGIDVEMHHGEHFRMAVDLYLPDGDVAIQLDPMSTHVSKVHADEARLTALRKTYTRVVRVREEPLPLFVDCVAVPPKATVQAWTAATMQHLGLRPRRVTEEQVTRALEGAAQRWQSVLTSPPSPALADRRDLAHEFVANLTNPGRGPKWLPISSRDTVKWRCTACGHQWSTGVYHRTSTEPTGCQPCSVRRRNEASALAPLGKRVADLAPALLDEFVENIDAPSLYVGSLGVGSHYNCLWRCSLCGRTWRATVGNRYKHSHVGCQPCNLRTAWTEGKRTSAAYDAQWEAALAVLMQFLAREGHASPALQHREGDFQLGNWVGRQRKMRSKMAPARRDRLEGLPGWVWDTEHAAWERGFNSLRTFAEREGHAAPLARHVEEGHRLGAWVSHQRKGQMRLSPERRGRLEALPGWRWEVSQGSRQRG